MRQRPSVLAIALCVSAFAACLGIAPTALARPRSRAPQVRISPSLSARHVLIVHGVVGSAARRREEARLEVRRRGRWAAVGSPGRVSPRRLFKLRWHFGPATELTVRATVVGGHRRAAFSRPVTLHVGDAGSTTYTVPRTSHLYNSGAVTSASPGPNGSTVVDLAADQSAPPVGGHVAIAPSPGLPDGMFATVVAEDQADSSWHLTLQRAAIDQVLSNVSVNLDQAVTPDLSATGDHRPGLARGSASHSLTIAGDASFDRRSSLGSIFSCKADGKPNDAASLLSSQTLLPLSITLHDMHDIFDFDPGSFFPHRDPSLLIQFSGQADARVGFQAKAGFSCELSDSYRQTHRITIPLGAIGPVPVTMYLEPTLSFEVSEAGSITLNQRHYFAVTLEQHGFAPFSAKLAHSADPVSLIPTAALDASLFAGGDLSVMFGAGAGPLDAQAGVYGAFGPDFDLAASTDQPGCVTATVHLEADFGVRLQFLDQRWDAQLASLSTKPANLGGPWCVSGTTTTTPPPPTPSPPAINVPTAGPTLVDLEQTAPNSDEGAYTFDDWSNATGEPADLGNSLPTSLSGYRCVVLYLNEGFASADEPELASYLAAGGTVIALGEHSQGGGPFDVADEALNTMAQSLGAGLSLDDDTLDSGPNVTYNVDSSPLTNNVYAFGYNWASSLSLSGNAQPLVDSADDSYTLIGAASVGPGTFVMSGDTDAFADSSEDYGQAFYEDADNGTFVQDLCP